jgi:RHS repeat-associated protein
MASCGGRSARPERAQATNRPSIQYHIDSNGAVVPDRLFVYMGNLLAASFEYGPGTWLYYTEDHLGSIRMVTNGAGQDICEKRYYPYGYEIVDFCQAPAAGGAPLKFAGMERDSSSGIDYDHARYMASLGGRFLSVDKVQGGQLDPQSWNRYSYARANPLRLTDPTGLYTFDCTLSAEECTRQENAFEGARQADLDPEKNSADVVTAAAAYGDPGEENGVVVSFGTPKKGGDAETTPDVSAPNGVEVLTATVVVKPGQTGTHLEGTVGHEGQHIVDARNFVATIGFRGAKLWWDLARNLTIRETEINAYRITQKIYAAHGYSEQIECAGCTLGAGVPANKADQVIQKILATPLYRPYLDRRQIGGIWATQP